jgi:hypothetical protein
LDVSAQLIGGGVLRQLRRICQPLIQPRAGSFGMPGGEQTGDSDVDGDGPTGACQRCVELIEISEHETNIVSRQALRFLHLDGAFLCARLRLLQCLVKVIRRIFPVLP